MVLAPGQEVLHYRLVEEIGRGGMGSVFRAEDLRLRRTVAVKILHSDRGDDGDRKRLLREARLASAMSHAGVVTIHALESTNEVDFIVMEHVEGMSLKAMIERGPLEPRVVARLGTRLADALDAAHRQGILHRDVKPSNVLVTKTGEAKLVDFGIARPMQKSDATRTETLDGATSEAPASDLSHEGAIVGTVAYMSPEQVRGDPLDARSDVFSLGATLYEALTGKRPFEGASAVWIGHAILHGEPAPPSSLRAGVPASVDVVVARALAKSRDARFASARELADALTRLHTAMDMEQADTVAELPPRETPNPAPKPKASRSRAPFAFALGLACAAVAAATYFGSRSPNVTTAPVIASAAAPATSSDPAMTVPATTSTPTAAAPSASPSPAATTPPSPPRPPSATPSAAARAPSSTPRAASPLGPNQPATTTAPAARPAPEDPMGNGIYP
jgi:serine/threonine protein kinase